MKPTIIATTARARRLALCLVLPLLTTACGQKGPLRLPPKNTAGAPSASVPSPANPSAPTPPAPSR